MELSMSVIRITIACKYSKDLVLIVISITYVLWSFQYYVMYCKLLVLHVHVKNESWEVRDPWYRYLGMAWSTTPDPLPKTIVCMK